MLVRAALQPETAPLQAWRTDHSGTLPTMDRYSEARRATSLTRGQWLTHGHTQKTHRRWCSPCFTIVRPYCSIGVCDFSIQARTLALIYTHVPIQPFAFWAVASISTRRVTLSLVTVNISARQRTGRSTLVVLEPSRTLQSYENKVARLKCVKLLYLGITFISLCFFRRLLWCTEFQIILW